MADNTQQDAQSNGIDLNQLSTSDANDLLQQGKISQDDFATVQQNNSTTIDNSKDLASQLGAPAGSQILASDIVSSAPMAAMPPASSSPNAVSTSSGISSPYEALGMKLLDKVTPEGQFSESSSSDTPTFDPAAQAATNKTATDLPGFTTEAQKAQVQMGTNINKLLVPAAQYGQDVSQDVIDRTVERQKMISDAYQSSQKSMQDAMQTLNEAKERATIDPQRYVKSMGVTDKTLTTIGLIFGGGANSYTAQLLQKNIDRDIDAQKQTFLNYAQVAQQQLGLANSQVNNAAVVATAQNAAEVTVLNGLSAYTNSVMNEITGTNAPAQAKVLNLALQTQQLNAQLKLQELSKGLFRAGDANTLNASGEMIKLKVRSDSGYQTPQERAASGSGRFTPNTGQQPSSQSLQIDTNTPTGVPNLTKAQRASISAPIAGGKQIQDASQAFLDALKPSQPTKSTSKDLGE